MASHDSTANDISTLNGLFKEIYADKIKDLTPEGVILYKEIPFVQESKQTGNLYHVPVVLGSEHGFTYGGAQGEAFNLNDAVAGVMKDATVQGYEMVLRSRISVGAISRSLKGGKQAFENASKHLVSNMLKSMTKRLEIQLMYGQTDIGTVETVTLNDTQFTIEEENFIPGVWAGAEGMKISVDGTKATVGSVDFETRIVTVLDDAGAALQLPAKTAGSAITFFGASGKEFAGIDKIISQSTGTLFGIEVGSYSLWKGNVLGEASAARALTLSLIEDAVEAAVEKGLTEQDVVAIVNPASWNNLLSEQTAKRSFDSSYKSEKMENGSSSIEFYGQNGKISVKPSIYCKKGSAYILCMEEFLRVGSRDISFDLPGFEGEFIFALQGANGYEMRAYTDQALLCTAPAKNTILRNVHGVPA